LVSPKEVRRDAVDSEPVSYVTMMSIQVNAHANNAGNGAFTAVRALRSEVGACDERVGPQV